MQRGTLPEVSNLASFEEQVEFRDSETDQPLNLASAQDIIITISSTPEPYRNGRLYGYEGGQLQGTLQGGEITMAPDFLSVTVRFTRTQMRALSPKTYALGARLIFEDDINEQQVLIGYLPVVEGL